MMKLVFSFLCIALTMHICVAYLCPSNPNTCPPEHIVNCLVPPCLYSKCHIPGAKCVDNYCGGCNAEWCYYGFPLYPICR